MKRRFWIGGLTIGAVGGLLAAAGMTYLDWRLNPGGLFRTSQGTQWTVVLETAASWFVPLGVAVSLGALALFGWLGRRR